MGDGRDSKVAKRVRMAGRAMTIGMVSRRYMPSASGSAAAIGTVMCVAGLLAPATAAAQSTSCRILCAPALKIEPTITTENLFRAPTIQTLEDGRIVESTRASRDTVFEVIFALEVPTQIPRIGLTLEAIFVPFGTTEENPFTGVSASALPGRSIRDNGVEIESELNIGLFDTDQTGGWVSSHFDIVDKFSPAAEPRAKSIYTHKLNFEWDTAFHLFNKLPQTNWLRNVEAEISLDYVATGLPKAGDLLGDERFIDDASPWSISVVFVFPLAPLIP
jgi:hypothetical protein